MTDDNLDLFNQERTEGMRRAVEHADRVEPEWSDDALAALQAYAILRRGESFLIEEVIKSSRKFFPQPPTTKAWGAVVKRAQREGWLVKDGFAIGAGNCCPKILWRHV